MWKSLKDAIKKDCREILPVTLFFFLAFTLVDITEVLMHKELATKTYSIAVIAVASIMMGKVVFIADRISCINRYSTRPLIYSTCWKSAIYVLCSFVVRILDHNVPFFIENGSLSITYERFMTQVEAMPFWVVQLWLSAIFIVFTAWRELCLAVGEKKVRELFFGR